VPRLVTQQFSGASPHYYCKALTITSYCRIPSFLLFACVSLAMTENDRGKERHIGSPQKHCQLAHREHIRSWKQREPAVMRKMFERRQVLPVVLLEVATTVRANKTRTMPRPCILKLAVLVEPPLDDVERGGSLLRTRRSAGFVASFAGAAAAVPGVHCLLRRRGLFLENRATRVVERIFGGTCRKRSFRRFPCSSFRSVSSIIIVPSREADTLDVVDRLLAVAGLLIVSDPTLSQ